MTTTFIGTTFPRTSDWHQDEKALIANIHQQIDQAFVTSRNLFINTTWFGPQFDNNEWKRYKQTIAEQQFDRVFLLAAADPVFLNSDQRSEIQTETNSELYLLGHFEGQYYFNFHSQVLPRYFTKYSVQDLVLKQPRYVYLNYNRKPRDHRNALVNYLIDNNLLNQGIVTLGKENNIYSKNVAPATHLTLNETPETTVGNWGMSMELGIPHDIHSLGNIAIWQNHFLNVVSETEFLPWDPMFISEKTWKPILGLRPFVINGQTKIYQYLRDAGFKTFNHHWDHINVENVTETQVHRSITEVIKYLTTQQLGDLYQRMLPDLIHNRDHFVKFSQQQQHKINNLFV